MNILDDNNFFESIKEGICVVDFFATWCVPCRIYGGTFEKAEANTSEAKFFKADVDLAPVATANLVIKGVPTTVFFKDGVEFSRKVGIVSEQEIKETILSGLE